MKDFFKSLKDFGYLKKKYLLFKRLITLKEMKT